MVQLTHFFAHSSRSFLYLSYIKFFFNVKQKLNPHSWRRYLIVCSHIVQSISSLISFVMIVRFPFTDLTIIRSSRTVVFQLCKVSLHELTNTCVTSWMFRSYPMIRFSTFHKGYDPAFVKFCNFLHTNDIWSLIA